MDSTSHVLNFWFPDDEYHGWWFKSTSKLDQQILDQQILDQYYISMTDTFNNFNLENYSKSRPEEIIRDIILLDQFSRNINRIVRNLDLIEYTNKAIQLSNEWIDKKYHLTCHIKWTVFAFLPIRHSKNKEQIIKLNELLQQIEQFNNSVSSSIIYKKFKLHTSRQLELLN